MIAPSSARPQAISATATRRPAGVTGTMSPYPTVDSVEQAHHTESPKVWIVACGRPRSTWYMARDAANPSSKADMPA